MKKTLRLLGITAIAAIIGFGFASCEGPAGLQGPGGGTGAAALVRVAVGGNAAASDYAGDASYLINFGSTLAPAELAVNRDLTITNTGNVTLPLTVTFSGYFEVEDEPFTLAPGASHTIVVTRPTVIDTATAQSYQSIITLSSTVNGFDDIEIMARLWVGPDVSVLLARVDDADDLFYDTYGVAVATEVTAIPAGVWFATNAQRDALMTAANTAYGVAAGRTPATPQATVNTAVENIETAITTFRGQRQLGTQGVIAVTPTAPTAWAITPLATPTSGTVNLATTTGTATFSVPPTLTTAGVTSAAPATATAAVAEGVLTITGVAAGTTTVTVALANHQSFTITVVVPGVAGPVVGIAATPTSVNVNSDTEVTATVTFTITGSNLPAAVTTIAPADVTITLLDTTVTTPNFTPMTVTDGNVVTTGDVNTFTFTVPCATLSGELVAILNVGNDVPPNSVTVAVVQLFTCDCDPCTCAGDCDCYECSSVANPCDCDDAS